jgi:ureidoacrylate peracid hydrolase
MAEPTLDPRKTALLFFDTLKVYLYEKNGGTLKKEAQAQVTASKRMLDAARALELPIVYAVADHRPDGADWSPTISDRNSDRFVDAFGKPRVRPATTRELPGAEVIDELAPRDGDYLIKKHRWSSFRGTHLDLSMRTAGIDTICIAGGSTDVGVAATAYAARDHDFNVVILRDACSASRKQVDDFFMDHVFPRLGRVRTVDEAIALLQAGAKQ